MVKQKRNYEQLIHIFLGSNPDLNQAMSWTKDENIQGFEQRSSEDAGQLYALLNAVWKGTRKITKVERVINSKTHTVYVTSERKL